MTASSPPRVSPICPGPVRGTALVLVLGCGAVWFAFVLAIWIVGRLTGIGRGRAVRASRAPDDGRENVRVIPPRNDGGG
jgi:hypothetical protein